MNSGRKELGLKNQFVYHWHWKHRLDCPSTDYMIVDEIQDFEEEEIEEFISATNKHFFFFGDTAQSIYEGLKETMPVEDIGYLLPRGERPKNFGLFRNYRLPINVARYVQYVGVDLEPFEESTYKSSEMAIPFVLKCQNLKEQIVSICQTIRRKDLSDVAILLPHNDMVKEVGDMLESQDVNFEMRYNNKEDWTNSIDTLDFDSTNPKLMTYHSSKGLQFETVFLPCIEDFVDDRKSDSKALYVAMTRTYRDLYIMYSGILPAPLCDIPTNLYKTTAIEEVKDI